MPKVRTLQEKKPTGNSLSHPTAKMDKALSETVNSGAVEGDFILIQRTTGGDLRLRV